MSLPVLGTHVLRFPLPLFPTDLQERNRTGLLAAALGSSVTLEGLTTSHERVQYCCA